jgi:uncharacterized OsmC-like protein
MAAAPNTSSVRPKEFHFPGNSRMARRAACRRPRGGQAGDRDHLTTGLPWQRPHHLESRRLLVTATASCLAVTFTGLASRVGLAYTSLSVDGDGVAGKRADGRFGFTRLSLRLELETEARDEAQARALAEEAARTCLVSASLDLPVETVIEVRRPSES